MWKIYLESLGTVLGLSLGLSLGMDPFLGLGYRNGETWQMYRWWSLVWVKHFGKDSLFKALCKKRSYLNCQISDFWRFSSKTQFPALKKKMVLAGAVTLLLAPPTLAGPSRSSTVAVTAGLESTFVLTFSWLIIVIWIKIDYCNLGMLRLWWMTGAASTVRWMEQWWTILRASTLTASRYQ